jgi:hypothetical protein
MYKDDIREALGSHDVKIELTEYVPSGKREEVDFFFRKVTGKDQKFKIRTCNISFNALSYI